MLDALLITRMQDEMTAALHETEGELAIEAGADGLMAVAMAQHRANFELWHEEDKAAARGSGGVSGCLVGGGARGNAAVQAVSADEDVQRSGVESCCL